MVEFLENIKKHHQQNLPFVVYCKPNSDTIIGVLQQNDTLYSVTDYTEKGFVFASFEGDKTYLIPVNQSKSSSIFWDKSESNSEEKKFDLPNDYSQSNFVSLVNKGIRAINDGKLKKVVLSRTETIDLYDFDLVTTFYNLVQLYPSTFVYCFFHPKIGLWIGATPERLLKVNGTIFETIALAGTQKNISSEEVVWPEKEKTEQQFVTDYIVAKLEDVATEVLVSDPHSVKAGSLWHIKTTISGTLNRSSSLQKVIEMLHPTPAVCGLPKEKAKAFILENENYDRNFYTGFLGELNVNLDKNIESTDLFVNLRCMQVVNSQALLYMGCGITKESIPEKEWEESVNKSMTMKRVL